MGNDRSWEMIELGKVMRSVTVLRGWLAVLCSNSLSRGAVVLQGAVQRERSCYFLLGREWDIFLEEHCCYDRGCLQN